MGNRESAWTRRRWASSGRHRRAAPGGLLRPRLEAARGARMSGYRRTVLCGGIRATLAIYKVFLLADWLLVPEGLRFATILHFAVVTQVTLMTGARSTTAIWGRRRTPCWRRASRPHGGADHDGLCAEREPVAGALPVPLAVMIAVYSNVNLAGSREDAPQCGASGMTSSGYGSSRTEDTADGFVDIPKGMSLGTPSQRAPARKKRNASAQPCPPGLGENFRVCLTTIRKDHPMCCTWAPQ